MAKDSIEPDKPQAARPQPEHQPAPTSVQPAGQPSPASNDSQATTSTEDSRKKDALEQNVIGEQGRRHPDTPAGQHATGSFTDEASEKPA